MDQYIFHRVFGSVVTLSLISIFQFSCLTTIWKELPTHPELQIFYDLTPRYNTIWNLILLHIYASMSLICDVSTIRNKEMDVPPNIRDFRFKIFHEVIFPQVLNMIVFWTIFFYDRELIFPTVANILLSPIENFVFHGFVIFYVFWELVFLPQDIPKRSDVKIKYILGINAAYFAVVLYTKYVDLGVWVYEVLTATEGTVLFPLVFSSMFILTIIAFYGQWYVKNLVWEFRKTCKVD